jgi:choice-of-anchor B domain-containing protein
VFGKIVLVPVFFALMFAGASAQMNITFRSQLTYPGQELANIWGHADAVGNEYALVGHTSGLSIVNVTDPDNPVQLHQVNGTWSYWREVRTWGNYAFVVTEGGNLGMQIIDLSGLPGSISTKYWKGTGAINNLLNKAHSLQITDGYLYLNGTNLFNGRTIIVSLADPWNPLYLGVIPGTYVHDGYVRNDTLWACNIYNGYVSVISVANKSTPSLIMTQNTPGNFPHNTWLNTSGSTLFATDEVSNSWLSSYDVSDVGNITLLDKIQVTPGSGSIVHNTHVHNDYAVTSWYRDGIVVVDGARPDNLVVVGHYDTSPLAGNGFNGCWGVYPYLPSGNILASDIEGGLFVLTPEYKRACYLEGVVTDSLTGSPLPNTQVHIISTSVSESTKITGQYKTGLANAGNYSITFACNGYVTKTINNVLLNNGILTTLNVQLLPVGTPLPVTWAYFEGMAEGDCNKLLWGTYTETNANGYYLQKSKDAVFFEDLDFINANNNNNLLTNYEYLHCKINNSGWYYRLKQVDLDGKINYSEIIFISGKPGRIELFPNPFTEEIIINTEAELIEILLFNSLGQEVKINYSKIQKKIDIPAELKSGIYYLKIITSKEAVSRKVVRK